MQEELPDFERILRQKLREIKPEFEEDAWEDLAMHLDKADSKRLQPYVLRWTYRLTAVWLLLCLCISPYRSGSSKGLHLTDDSLLIKNSYTQTDKLYSENRHRLADRRNRSKISNHSRVDPTQRYHTNKELQNQQNDNHSSKKQVASLDQSLQKKELQSDFRSIQADEHPKSKESTLPNVVENQGIILQSRPISITSLATLPLYSGQADSLPLLALEPIEAPIFEEKSSLQANKWRIGAVVQMQSSQLQSISQRIYTAPMGMAIAYQSRANWALQSGVLYAKSQYLIADYRSVAYLKNTGLSSLDNNQPAPPMPTQASTHRLELPLEAVYTVKQGSKNRFFVGLGTSSFITLSQTFEQERTLLRTFAAGNVQYYQIKEKRPLVNAGSTLNIRIGWERKLSKNFAFELSPYTQFGLQGIGREQFTQSAYGIRGAFWIGK
jgi:hypothetical protein